MDFLICYEHIVREIENDTLLKHELEKRGYSCKIIHFNDMDCCLHMGKDKAKVVVTPWLRYDTNVARYLTLAKKPYKLVNLQWEQVYCANHLKQGLTSTSGQALRAYHMCWGNNSRDRLVAAGLPEENVAVVGAIQMDYGQPLFKDYYLPREAIAAEFGLDTNKRWNLLVSSFAYANYGESGIRRMEKELNLSMTDLVEIHKQSQKLTLDWVEELLKTSDCEFIYRPHPSEKVDQRLNAMAKQYPHFHVISDRSVKQWARVCDKVNLWISTSNAELLSMGVDFAILRPAPIPDDYEVESMRNETTITDCEAFIRFNTSDAGENTPLVAERLARLEHFYSFDPEYPAYKRTADYLEQVLKSQKGQRYHFTAKQRLKETVAGMKRYLIAALTRKCYFAGNMDPVRCIPLKPEVKKNMELTIQKRKNKEKLESALLSYIKKNEIHS